MYRGTTPELTLTLETDLNLDTLESCWVTIKSATNIKNIGLEDLFVDNENKTITVGLSQEDTLKFGPGEARVQVRMRTASDQAFASSEATIRIDQILKDGVI